jgi:predicted RNA methylase
MTSNLFSKVVENYKHLKYELFKAQTFNLNHFGFPPIYYNIMESDETRIGVFQKAFDQLNFDDKIVCEAGIGRLALTKFYLPKVKKAYLIENNPELFDFIQTEIEKSGYAHKVELIFGDAMTVELPEKVDFIVGELMSIYCANEYQVQIFKHLRQFLKLDGQLLPQKIVNIVQLASANFDANYRHYPINFIRHLPTQFSLQTVVNTIDLYTVEAEKVIVKIPIIPILSGQINAVFMQSFIEITEGANFTGTDSLMPPTVCRLEEDVIVKAGEVVHLWCEFNYGTSLDEARFFID